MFFANLNHLQMHRSVWITHCLFSANTPHDSRTKRQQIVGRQSVEWRNHWVSKLNCGKTLTVKPLIVVKPLRIASCCVWDGNLPKVCTQREEDLHKRRDRLETNDNAYLNSQNKHGSGEIVSPVKKLEENHGGNWRMNLKSLRWKSVGEQREQCVLKILA